MAPFVHHPQQGYTGTDQVGARRVEFQDGVAEVDLPSLLGRYTRLGYVITDAGGHDVGEPPRNGTTEAWRDYARTRAQGDGDLRAIEELGRDELVERFGTPVTDPVTTPAPVEAPGVVDH